MAQSPISKDHIIEEYRCPATTLTSGQVGSPAGSVTVNIQKTGYVPKMCSTKLIKHGANYHVCSMMTGDTLYFVFYRANTIEIQVPEGDVTATVYYEKSS